MNNQIVVLDNQNIVNKIYNIRNMQVMIDRDLAQLYEVETRVLNQAVKRNIERFPPEFMFQLTEKELDNWKSQIVISNKETMGIRKMPFAFTEQGISMLSGILKSKVAIKISIKIINSFVEMRNFLTTNAAIFQRLDQLEYKHIGTNQRIDQILNALETNELSPRQGIFYEGQIFDAYNFVSDLFRSAESRIIIIDNYIDDSVLVHLTQKKESVKVTIYTKHISQLIKLSLKKFNLQYKNVKIKEFSKSHDRFIIIDDKEIYHFGASLKDLGKKWFGFSKFHKDALDILEKL